MWQRGLSTKLHLWSDQVNMEELDSLLRSLKLNLVGAYVLVNFVSLLNHIAESWLKSWFLVFLHLLLLAKSFLICMCVELNLGKHVQNLNLSEYLSSLNTLKVINPRRYMWTSVKFITRLLYWRAECCWSTSEVSRRQEQAPSKREHRLWKN